MNWKTPTGHPADQARRASPKAAVDLPLPSPVCTMSSGLGAPLAGAEPVVGHDRYLALGHQAASFARMMRASA